VWWCEMKQDRDTKWICVGCK